MMTHQTGAAGHGCGKCSQISGRELRRSENSGTTRDRNGMQGVHRKKPGWAATFLPRLASLSFPSALVLSGCFSSIIAAPSDSGASVDPDAGSPVTTQPDASQASDAARTSDSGLATLLPYDAGLSEPPPDSTVGVAPDAATASGRPDSGQLPRGCVDELDLLMVIDNSNSMREEQEALARQIPMLVRALASGDRDLDGVQDFTPIESLHIGITSTDMGSAGTGLSSCGTELGDDGLLLNGSADCSSSPARGVFAFAAGNNDAAEFTADVACAAALGTGGCGIEQQLEAMLKAVSPSQAQTWTRPDYEPPAFGYIGRPASAGHGDGANAGFLREDSALAIVLISDEEDCSAANADVFLANSGQFQGLSLNLRCSDAIDPSTGESFPQSEIVFPVERYAAGETGHAGLFGLRRDPRKLIFIPIVGIPPEVASTDPNQPIDWEAILDHPHMQSVVDPLEPQRLGHSCVFPGVSEASPPRRIVQVAQRLDALGATASVQSICASDYRLPLAILADAVANLSDIDACN